MNPKAGLTFAVAMQAFLRCDPDIIMVGEMRDKETVGDGHRGLAHRPPRVRDAAYEQRAGVHRATARHGHGSIQLRRCAARHPAQRLARRLCPSCKKPHVATEGELKALLDGIFARARRPPRPGRGTWTWPAQNALQGLDPGVRQREGRRSTLYTAVGCEVCNGTGYKGRVGLHELLVGTDAIKKNIQEHARVAEMFATAVEEGMRTLKQDGIEKVLLGVTDIHQVRSVCIK